MLAAEQPPRGAGAPKSLLLPDRRYPDRRHNPAVSESKIKPRIEGTRFGSITLGGAVYDHDVLVLPGATVRRRKKKLSKAVYGTSHTISLAEAKYVYGRAKPADRLIIGSGQHDQVRLSAEAADYLERKGCETVLAPTPEAIKVWNRAKGRTVGLFHVTC